MGNKIAIKISIIIYYIECSSLVMGSNSGDGGACYVWCANL